MANIPNIMSLNGGMNLDVEDKYLKPEQTREVYNLRGGTTEDDNLFARENLLGNEKISFGLPAGTNTVIGSCKDYARNAILRLIHNSNGKHCVIIYYIDTKTSNKVLFDEPILNLDLDHLVQANVLGDLFIFNDNYNPPRKINIVKALNYSCGISVPANLQYSSITEQVLDRIKYPPIKPPIVYYVNDTNYKYNNLRGKLFQFAYRNIYDDKEKSVLSPISKIPLPINDEFANGHFVEDPTINNKITIQVKTGTEEVEIIELFVREGNFGHWKLVERVFKYDEDGHIAIASNINFYFYFYNNQIGIVGDQKDLARSFDYVAKLSACQEVIGNRIFDANFIEGDNNVDVDMVVNAENIFIDYNNIRREVEIESHVLCTYFPTPLARMTWKITIPYDLSTGEIIVLTLKNTSTATVFSVSHIVLAGDTFTDIRDSLIAQFLQKDINSSAECSHMPTSDNIFYVENSNSVAWLPNKELTGWIYGDAKVEPTFKDGAWHEFGIVYSDRAKRCNFVGTNDNCKKYVKFIAAGYFSAFYKVEINLEINHTPPSWATQYHIVYTKNTSIEHYIQFGILSSDIIRGYPINRISIRVNKHIKQTREDFKQFNLSTWDWQKGDRIRFLGKIGSGDTQVQYVHKVIDMEILGIDYPSTEPYGYKMDEYNKAITDINGNKVRDEGEQLFVIQDFNIENYGFQDADLILIEIYRPRKELLGKDDEKVFYYIGETYNIEGGYHKGGTQDQTASQPAKIKLTGGDSYVKYRITNIGSFPCYDPNFSDFYDSDCYDIGGSNVINSFAEQKRLTSNLRYSGKYIQETNVNELSRVDYDSYDVLSATFGAINKIIGTGFLLKIYQQYKPTSIYIDRVSFIDAKGKETLQKSDNVIGTKMISETNYGVEHASAVVKHERNIYFIDYNNGQILRDAPNGIFPISKYGVESWVRNKLLDFKNNYENVKLFAGYNDKYKEVYFTFVASKKGGDEEGWTLVFHEPDNLWYYFPEFAYDTVNFPEGYEDLGQSFVSFMKGDLWLHDVNPIRNNFYGEQKKVKINLIANNEPLKVKVYKNSVLNSNKVFYTEFNIPANENYIRGMFSRIKKERYESKEGVFYSDILKNMLTNSNTPTLSDLINGEDMRGQIMKVYLEDETTTETVISSVEIGSIHSQLSGVKK